MPVDAADRALLSTTPAPTRRPRSRSRTASTCSATRPTAATARSQKTGYARALLDGADVIVMVHADNQYDPGLVAEMVAPILAGRRRHGDRLAAARRPRDRGRHAALEVARQPAADRDREPRLRRALLRVPHRLPRLLAPTSCARSRSCATPTTSSSTRRSSPRCSRAARAWSRSRSRRATSARRRASTSLTSVRYGAARRSGVLGALPARPPRGAGRCCAAPPATSAPSARSDARSAASACSPCCSSRLALVLRIAYVDATPGLRARPRRASTTTSTRVSIAAGRRLLQDARLRPPDRVPPARLPVLPRRRVPRVQADREPVAERVHVARIAQAFVGTALVALIGRDRRAAVGAVARRWSRWRWRAVYVPADPRRRQR